MKVSVLLSLTLSIFGFFLLTGSSCYPDKTSSRGVSLHPAAVAAAPATAPSPTVAAVELITKGDFEQAAQLIQSKPDAESGELTKLISRYDSLQQSRLEERQKALQEQMEELDKIRQKTVDKQVLDVNDIDDAMIAVIRAREFTPDQQKDQILEDPFVKKVLDQLKSNAAANEANGKWIDAYAHSYYWLTLLYEDDKDIRNKAEELTELAEIELALKDSNCSESARERFEGIEPVMFLRALHLLDSNYVRVVEYGAMADKALHRCRLLGQVLANTKENLAWSADAEAVRKWQSGLEAVKTQLAREFPENEKMKAENLAELLEDILALDSITLKLPNEAMIAEFTEAAFEALDPFTNMVWPWAVKDFEKSMTQQFTGIGVEISKSSGTLKVVSLLPDTPAYKSGMDAGDEIVAVNGEETKEMTIYCAVSKITGGPKGTKVLLKLRRPSTGEIKELNITRDKIVVNSLRGWTRQSDGAWDYMIDPDNAVGYVRLTAFTETTGEDLDAVLKQLEKKGLKGLILDLRFNSGGYLQAAADVVDLFVEEGVIVKSNPRHGFATYEIAHRSGTHPNFPMVVLINEASASASEIVAGALQDPKHQRATLVGERSYGKGSVQVVTPFTGGGSQLKYTVAYYHLPSDQQVKNRYQMEKLNRKDWGIAPDVEVKMLSNELKSMIDLQRDNDVLFRTDHQDGDSGSSRHTVDETVFRDPQLSTALIVVQSKMASQGTALKLKDYSPEEIRAARAVKSSLASQTEASQE